MNHEIEREVGRLHQMATSEICERYSQLLGERARSRHRPYLIRRIAWRLQALAEGDLSERARRRAEELANDADVRVTPPRPFGPRLEPSVNSPVVATVSTDRRLPAPGTAIVRQYKGQTLRVLVTLDGLEFNGKRYKTISAVAKAITGSHVNGYRFFKLDREDEE